MTLFFPEPHERKAPNAHISHSLPRDNPCQVLHKFTPLCHLVQWWLHLHVFSQMMARWRCGWEICRILTQCCHLSVSRFAVLCTYGLAQNVYVWSLRECVDKSERLSSKWFHAYFIQTKASECTDLTETLVWHSQCSRSCDGQAPDIMVLKPKEINKKAWR